MGISKLARFLAVLLIFQQTRCVYSSPLNLPPLRDCPKHKRYIARGFKSRTNRQVPFPRWPRQDVGLTSPEFVPEIVRKRLIGNENENKFPSRIEEVEEKRKKQQNARILWNKFSECLIINNTGDVKTSSNRHTCRTYGKFCQITNGSSLQLYGINTKKYLAINDNRLIYSTTNGQSSDTLLTYRIINFRKSISIGIYRKMRNNNNKKCFLDVLSNAVTQRCSFNQAPLIPENLGVC